MHRGLLSKQVTSLSKQIPSAVAAFFIALLFSIASVACADEPAKPADDKATVEKAVQDRIAQEKADNDYIVEQRAKDRFVQADKDRDGKLTPEEFVVGRGDEPTARRDFKLFDFNHDGTGDVLLENFITREVATWTVQNGQWAGSTAVGVLPAGFQYMGVADFNGGLPSIPSSTEKALSRAAPMGCARCAARMSS